MKKLQVSRIAAIEGSRAFQRPGLATPHVAAAERLLNGMVKRWIQPPLRGGSLGRELNRGLKPTATIKQPLRGKEKTHLGSLSLMSL